MVRIYFQCIEITAESREKRGLLARTGDSV